MKQLDRNTELIGRYLAGEITPGERRDLFAWKDASAENRQYFEEMEQVWNLTAAASELPHFETDKELAWAKVGVALLQKNSAAANAGTALFVRSKNMRRWSAAAAILFALGAGLWWISRQPEQSQWVEIQTVAKEKKDLALPDGSRVWLNENSKITYQPGFEKRLVTLDGEAFFEVEKMNGKPFEITSGDATTTVVGTSFNVRAYPAEDRIEVTVKTGVVKLSSNKPHPDVVALEAGESGVFNKKDQSVQESPKEIANADAWKTEELTFEDAPVSNIFGELERYFDVRIEVVNPSILNCHYKTSFRQPKLEEVLDNISFGLNLKWKKEGDVFRFSGEGCNSDN